MCKADTKSDVAAPAAGEHPMCQPELKPKFVKAFEPQQEFHWVGTDEPHATRRKLILAKHPEIKELFGHCTKSKYVAFFVVALQTTLAYYSQYMTWPVYVAVAYIIGGTCNHNLMLAMHELSHNLMFKKMIHNRIYGLFANLPVGVPSAISFKRYHMEHHRYQGEEGVDVDLPTPLEGKLFNTTISKLLFVMFQVLFYSFRPLFVNPKPPGVWELYNWIVCIAYNTAIYRVAGAAGVFYLLLSTLLGAGLHPVAGHFIAEHYEFILGYETYSYYGPLNFFTYNVGYHNEHHDFPFVPGSRLPKVRAIAPEFYENLPQHSSWVYVLWDYITNPNIGAFSRIKRHNMSDDEKKKIKND